MRIALALTVALSTTAACQPSVIEIARKTSLDPASGAIAFDGRAFPASFTAPGRFEGDLRMKVRTHRADFPFFTHDLLVTSGDFSDPDRVKISARGGGNYIWRARTKPAGTLVCLHVIPGGVAVASALERLEEGRPIALEGKVELHSTVRDDQEGWVKLNHDNHKFFYALEVR